MFVPDFEPEQQEQSIKTTECSFVCICERVKFTVVNITSVHVNFFVTVNQCALFSKFRSSSSNLHYTLRSDAVRTHSRTFLESVYHQNEFETDISRLL